LTKNPIFKLDCNQKANSDVMELKLKQINVIYVHVYKAKFPNWSPI